MLTAKKYWPTDRLSYTLLRLELDLYPSHKEDGVSMSSPVESDNKIAALLAKGTHRPLPCSISSSSPSLLEN